MGIIVAWFCLDILLLAACGNEDDEDGASSGAVWTDPSSGLAWQVTPSSEDLNWEEALDYCNNLSLDGHDDWRLPSISELRTLIRGCEGTVPGGACGVTDDCTWRDCKSDECRCQNGMGPNNGCYGTKKLPGWCGWYWSSTPVAGEAGWAWRVSFNSGEIYTDTVNDASDDGVRCVR